jgi:hypothetical protein
MAKAAAIEPIMDRLDSSIGNGSDLPIAPPSSESGPETGAITTVSSANNALSAYRKTEDEGPQFGVCVCGRIFFGVSFSKAIETAPT